MRRFTFSDYTAILTALVVIIAYFVLKSLLPRVNHFLIWLVCVVISGVAGWIIAGLETKH